MASSPSGPRKIKFVKDNWLVFEEADKLWAAHFCAGTEEYQKKYSQLGIKRGPWFHDAVDVEVSDSCPACNEEVPKHFLMVAKIGNVDL
jgi:hypothetical protein